MSTRLPIFAEATELLSSLADDPCERLDDPEQEDNRQAVDRPTGSSDGVLVCQKASVHLPYVRG
jgi:hypothetical protein